MGRAGRAPEQSALDLGAVGLESGKIILGPQKRDQPERDSHRHELMSSQTNTRGDQAPEAHTCSPFWDPGAANQGSLGLGPPVDRSE